MAASSAVSSGKTMAKKATLQIFTKGCFHVEWNMGGKILPLIKIGQVGFEVLSRDLMEQSFSWTAGSIYSGT
jgi:hypothetical protein